MAAAVAEVVGAGAVEKGMKGRWRNLSPRIVARRWRSYETLSIPPSTGVTRSGCVRNGGTPDPWRSKEWYDRTTRFAP